MGLLQPDSGLVFWVSLAFLTVLFVLAKWGFPVIIRSLEERKLRIDSSLENAAEVERRLSQVKSEVEQLRLEAQTQSREIVHQANALRDEILSKAKQSAEQEARRIISEAKQEAQLEREAILADARSEVALLAASLTERILREELKSQPTRLDVAMRLLSEVEQKVEPKKRN